MEIKLSEPLHIFYPDQEGFVVIACPFCNFAKKIEAAKYRNSGKSLKVRCRCGKIFTCAIEFRRYFRKKVNLAGEYVLLKNQRKGDLMVEDLSMGGMGFSNLTPHQLGRGDILEVTFRLDDKKKTELKRRVKVVSVKGHFIGAEFAEKQRFDKELGFYLLP
ncbi:MAG: PilZ domain-containing protein [Desulfobacterales bacterium]